MEEKDMKNSTYLIYAILFVIILILIGITVTYGFFKINTTYDNTLSELNATMDCIDISYNEANTINLDYNYPISDEYALENVTPVTVTVTNNCVNNLEDVNYALTITTLSEETGYISNDKIRYNVTRKIGSEEETTLKNTDYLSNLTALTSGATFDYLKEDLDTRAGINAYTNRTSYIIDSASITNNTINTYNIYLWVDYYEGDLTHTGLNDNSTQNQEFAAAISLVVNPSN